MKQVKSELKRRGFGSIVPPSKVLAFVGAADASIFLAQLRGALDFETDVALLGADWPERERFEARGRLVAFAESEKAREWRQEFGPLFYIASGGTTGERRFAVHTGRSLQAAARGYSDRFGVAACAAWNVLPLHHVGGLMTLLRALEAQVPWQMGDYRTLSESPPEDYRNAISLVPTQLHRLLKDSAAIGSLRCFKRIFIGGAGLSERDADNARREELALSPCYGMTETAAMVAALEPEDFLRGVEGCGYALPHAELTLSDREGDQEAAIGIASSAIALGWDTGETFDRQVFWTQDAGHFDPEGRLVVDGRFDRMINSGGEKVDPLLVEQAIRNLAGVEDVAVAGFDDLEWGEVVVAFVVGGCFEPAKLSSELRKRLRRAEVPKVVIRLGEIPRSAVGKLNRSALKEIWATQRKG